MIDLTKIKARSKSAKSGCSHWELLFVDIPACIKEIERLHERFGWIAEQGCEKIVENGQMKCSQTGRCMTEWCYPCYARKALEAE